MEQTDRLSDGWIVSFRESVAERKQALHILGNQQYPSLATAEARGCTVIFAGVLYNGEEVSGAATTGVGEAETSAAAQILYAYLRYGEEVLRRVKGVFALFIWDGKRDILLCVRDPLGMYPLFYAYAGRELLLSSSLESLIRHPQVSAAVNRAALAEHLCHRWPKLQETFFAHVNRIPPGHVMQIADSRRRVYRYWDPAPPHHEVHWLKEDEIGRFTILFDQAVSHCLERGPVAIYLSGGLDSVSVAAVAAEQCRSRGRQPPLALSLVFPDAECNEETVQRSVAHSLGLPQVLASFDRAVGSQGMLRAALDMSSKWSMPLLNTYYPAYHFLGLEGQRRGYKTILTGGGGDEWLSVSPYYAADLLRRLNLRGLSQLWDNMQRSYPLPRFILLRNLL